MLVIVAVGQMDEMVAAAALVSGPGKMTQTKMCQLGQKKLREQQWLEGQ